MEIALIIKCAVKPLAFISIASQRDAMSCGEYVTS
jgi:hypothetical protein